MFNFADDTATFICDHNPQKILNSLEENAKLAICQFQNNYMKQNTDKCPLLISGFKHEAMWTEIEKDIRLEKSNVKLQGLITDKSPGFDKHGSKLSSKAIRKLSTFSRMSRFLSLERRIIFEALIGSQFKYCSLIWMFHSRYTNIKINRLRERTHITLNFSSIQSSFILGILT